MPFVAVSQCSRPGIPVRFRCRDRVARHRGPCQSARSTVSAKAAAELRPSAYARPRPPRIPQGQAIPILPSRGSGLAYLILCLLARPWEPLPQSPTPVCRSAGRKIFLNHSEPGRRPIPLPRRIWTATAVAGSSPPSVRSLSRACTSGSAAPIWSAIRRTNWPRSPWQRT